MTLETTEHQIVIAYESLKTEAEKFGLKLGTAWNGAEHLWTVTYDESLKDAHVIVTKSLDEINAFLIGVKHMFSKQADAVLAEVPNLKADTNVQAQSTPVPTAGSTSTLG